VIAKVMADYREIVVQRLHVGIELLFDVPRQIAEVPVPERHHGPGEQNLPIPLTAFEGGGKSEKCLARSRRTRQRDKPNVVVEQGLERETLLRVPRGDTVSRCLFDASERTLRGAIGR